MIAFLRDLFRKRAETVLMPAEPWAIRYVKRRAPGLVEWASENKPEVREDLAVCHGKLAVLHVLNKHSGLAIGANDSINETMPLFLPAMQRLHDAKFKGA